MSPTREMLVYIPFDLKLTNVLDVARAREVLSELVKRYRHHSVRRVEGLLQCVTRRLQSVFVVSGVHSLRMSNRALTLC